MLGEKINGYKTELHLPPWTVTTGNHGSCVTSVDSVSRCYSPSSVNEESVAIDARWSDHFRMFEFKVRLCTSVKPHDWAECPFAHPGEKARRRDPRTFGYSSASCADFRRGSCRRGNACGFAHGVFESWLHPARYRTQLCNDGTNCKRRVCFFAHSPHELRVLTDGWPRRVAVVEAPSLATFQMISQMPGDSVDEIFTYLEQTQLNKVNSMTCSWMVWSSSPRRHPESMMFEDPNPNPDVSWILELVK